jgi:hypothetical protein
MAQIAASIRRFGFTNPVLVDDANSIIAGHGRAAAARRLSLGEVPTLRSAGSQFPAGGTGKIRSETECPIAREI